MGLFVHAPVHACNFPTMYCILHFDCQLLYSYVLSKASQYFLDLISCINPNSAVKLVLMSWPQAMHFIYCKPVELLAFCGIPWHCRQAIIVIYHDCLSAMPWDTAYCLYYNSLSCKTVSLNNTLRHNLRI